MATSQPSSQSGHFKHGQRLTRKTHLSKNKNPNDSVLVYIPQERARSLGKNSTRYPCSMYKILILAFVVSTCAVCVLVLVTTSLIEKKVMERVTSQLQNLHLDHPRGMSYQKNELSDLKRRSVSRRRQRRRHQGRRGKRSGPCCHHRHSSMRSAVHLYITSDRNFKTDVGNYFVWKEAEDHSRTSSGFTYIRSAHHTRSHDIIGVVIQHQGLYEIYSQSVIKGRRDNSHPYYCAQQIVRKRDGVETILVKSYITQHGLGMAIPATVNSHNNYWPIDSSFQYGVFLLRPRDEIRVSIPSSCSNFRFSNSNSKAFYFGVARK